MTVNLPMLSKVATLAQSQSYDFPIINEATLKVWVNKPVTVKQNWRIWAHELYEAITKTRL